VLRFNRGGGGWVGLLAHSSEDVFDIDIVSVESQWKEQELEISRGSSHVVLNRRNTKSGWVHGGDVK